MFNIAPTECSLIFKKRLVLLFIHVIYPFKNFFNCLSDCEHGVLFWLSYKSINDTNQTKIMFLSQTFIAALKQKMDTFTQDCHPKVSKTAIS